MRAFALFVGVAVSVVWSSTQTFAQAQCSEGRTATGLCVDATIGSLARERVRVFTQSRLSYSGPAAVPPYIDRRYDALRDWGQGLTREIYGPCGANFCP